MFAAIVIVAVFLTLRAVADQFLLHWFLEPLVGFVFPTALLVAAIYGQGEVRAFFIGALVPCYRLLFNDPDSAWTVGQWVGGAFWLLFLCAVCGAVAVAVRRWIVRHNAG
jgi:hypothetical protein